MCFSRDDGEGSGCSESAVYALGVCQVAVMFAVILAYPLASVQIFVYSPCVSNGTLTHACGSTHSTRVALALPCMTLSVAASAFVSSTFSLAERGAISEGVPYSAEAMSQTGLWNALFWFLVAGAHAVVVAAACSPGDAFAVAGATFLMVSFLAKLCACPDSADAGDHGAAANMGVTVANASILGYMAGAGVAFYSIPAQYSNRFVLLFLLMVLDYFLGIGHLWDRAPDMKTAGNCRLFWACSSALCLAAMYGAWSDDLLLPGAAGTVDPAY